MSLSAARRSRRRVTSWKRPAVAVLAAAAACGAGLRSAARAQPLTGYEAFDWSRLSFDKSNLRAGLASSYDRTASGTADGADWNHYDPALGSPVVTELTGPGVLTRFWTPHETTEALSSIRVYVDGSPVIGTSTGFQFADAFLGGSFGAGPQFRAPLVQTANGGQVSYEPIPFRNSVRVEYQPGHRAAFYQLNYVKYQGLPPGVDAPPSFNGTLTAAQATARQAAVATANVNGANPAGSNPSAVRTTPLPLVVLPGLSTPLLNLPAGGGTIRELNLDMGTSTGDAQLDGLRLRAYYDGAASPAIDVPVAHFFGVGHGRAAYKSAPLGVKDDGSFYSYWPMPFRQGVRVELFNSTGSTITTGASSVEYVPGAPDAKATYLHAAYQAETTTQGQAAHNVLDVAGRGHYVGNLLSMTTPNAVTLEGDAVIVVDGDSARPLHGTGLEDEYNGGYYYNRIGDPNYQANEAGLPDTGPFHGLLKITDSSIFIGDPVNTEQYRWMIADAVPFTSGIRVDLENPNGVAGVNFGSTAFYYLNVPEPGTAGPLGATLVPALARRPRRRPRA